MKEEFLSRIEQEARKLPVDIKSRLIEEARTHWEKSRKSTVSVEVKRFLMYVQTWNWECDRRGTFHLEYSA